MRLVQQLEVLPHRAEKIEAQAIWNISGEIADFGEDVGCRDLSCEALDDGLDKEIVINGELLRPAVSGNPFAAKLTDEIQDQQIGIDEEAAIPIFRDQRLKIFVQEAASSSLPSPSQFPHPHRPPCISAPCRVAQDPDALSA